MPYAKTPARILARRLDILRKAEPHGAAMTPAGLEPAIPGSVGRCLIHWATGPLSRVQRESLHNNKSEPFAKCPVPKRHGFVLYSRRESHCGLHRCRAEAFEFPPRRRVAGTVCMNERRIQIFLSPPPSAPLRPAKHPPPTKNSSQLAQEK